MKNRCLFSFFITLFFISTYSQTVNIDSLYLIEKTTQNSKDKVDRLISLYKKSTKQHHVRKDIIDDALQIAEKIAYTKGIGICYNRKGITARYEQNYGQSILYHKKALLYLEKTKDTFYIAKCMNSIGVTYRKLNSEKEAFEYYLKALKFSEKIDNTRGVSISLNGIGNLFLNTEQYDKALSYLKRALKIEIQQKNKRGQEYGYANIGEIYLGKKEYDSAYYYFDKALKLSLKYPRKESEAIKHYLFGKLYQKQGLYQKSLIKYQQSIPKLKEYKNTRYLSKVYINMGIDELYLKHLNKAYQHIDKGLQLAKSINSKENITLGYDALVRYFSLKNDYKSALKAHKKAKIFHDSIVNVTSQKSMINTEVIYEIQEKDKEIQLLANAKRKSEEKARYNSKRLIVVVIFGIGTIFILIVFFYLQRKNSDLELQQQNSEIQNYLLKIKELEQIPKKQVSSPITPETFKEFNLSKREIEVLTYISKGLNNEEISEKMFVSKNTIKTHITHIYSKLDVKNRIQAIKKIQTK